MITLAKIKSVILSQGKRIAKVVQFGPKTVGVSAPFGDDSSPLKDMIAIHASTGEAGESVVIGYINKNQISQPGEKRIFSLAPDGSLSFSIHLKGDGTCEIGGAADNLVRYVPLNAGLQAQDTSINLELTKIATAIASLGGTYAPVPISTDISAAKINQIKSP